MSDSETDTDEHPLRAPPTLANFRASGAGSLAVDGATVVDGVLSKKEASAAKKACTLLRDAAGISYVFSSPASSAAPPCGNESLWLDDAAMDSYDTDAGDALRKALKKSQVAVEKALGCAVERASVPMASVGQSPALTERLHRGVDGVPSGAEILLATSVLCAPPPAASRPLAPAMPRLTSACACGERQTWMPLWTRAPPRRGSSHPSPPKRQRGRRRQIFVSPCHRTRECQITPMQ